MLYFHSSTDQNKNRGRSKSLQYNIQNMIRTVERTTTQNTKQKTTIMTATILKELRTQIAGQQSLHEIRLKSTMSTFTYILPLI